MKNFDMEQCLDMIWIWIWISWFSTGYKTGSLHKLLEDENLWTPHALKQLEITSWFHTKDISVHSSDPKFTHSQMSNHS